MTHKYKHALMNPDTHQALKIYQYENKLNSFNEAIEKLLKEHYDSKGK